MSEKNDAASSNLPAEQAWRGFPATAPPSVSFVPTDEECLCLWDAFGMLPNVRAHSLLVACLATSLAELAREAGLPVEVTAVRAAALLHDLAKTYTIRHGGNHCQLGGAWVQALTGNASLAQGVVHHVSWPGELDLRTHFLPLAIIYSDKRVKHNQIVTLETRFDDLLVRYGQTEYIRSRINQSFQQAAAIERALATTLGITLHERTFGCRGLVG